ncbi:hypothetical protein [Actinomadura sp. HBU206391]|uniref:hypothetical protein n=1 Tax=Actinomadura sp. HBU206391 TaxID=2731692 RepID=UPI00164FDDEF|nr:hypothetical protein [Actinomadura sp. HBU206391]MBC6460661.1 hypothetical protein [Actinomadura sp. HBU206391]
MTASAPPPVTARANGPDPGPSARATAATSAATASRPIWARPTDARPARPKQAHRLPLSPRATAVSAR